MRNPHNIRLGQKVYTTNYIPLSKETIIKERTVVAIGRNYFYLDTVGSEPVRLEDLRYESPTYSQANFTVYLTQQEILYKWERYQVFSELKSLFIIYGDRDAFNLQQLRAVALTLGIATFKCNWCGWSGTEQRMQRKGAGKDFNRYCPTRDCVIIPEIETTEEVSD